MFAAVTDAYRANACELSPEHVVANLLRTPSVAFLLNEHEIDIRTLLQDLGAAAPGQSRYDVFRRMIELSQTFSGEEPPEAVAQALIDAGSAELPSEGFVALLQSDRLSSVMDAMITDARDWPEESITPSRLLLTFVQSDAQIRSLLGRYGLTQELVLKHLGKCP